MKNVFFCLSVAFCSFFVLSSDALASDDDSLLLVFSRLQNLPEELVDSVKSLLDGDKDLGNEVLKNKILQILEPLATENFRQEWEAKIDSGLACGWQLACTGAFDWALPAPSSRYYRIAVKKNDGRAEIACKGLILDIFSLPEKFLQDTASNYQDIVDPRSKDLRGIRWESVYKMIFSFEKTSSGWKISGFKGEARFLNFAGYHPK